MTNEPASESIVFLSFQTKYSSKSFYKLLMSANLLDQTIPELPLLFELILTIFSQSS